MSKVYKISIERDNFEFIVQKDTTSRNAVSTIATDPQRCYLLGLATITAADPVHRLSTSNFPLEKAKR